MVPGCIDQYSDMAFQSGTEARFLGQQFEGIPGPQERATRWAGEVGKKVASNYMKVKMPKLKKVPGLKLKLP